MLCVLEWERERSGDYCIGYILLKGQEICYGSHQRWWEWERISERERVRAREWRRWGRERRENRERASVREKRKSAHFLFRYRDNIVYIYRYRYTGLYIVIITVWSSKGHQMVYRYYYAMAEIPPSLSLALFSTRSLVLSHTLSLTFFDSPFFLLSQAHYYSYNSAGLLNRMIAWCEDEWMRERAREREQKRERARESKIEGEREQGRKRWKGA